MADAPLNIDWRRLYLFGPDTMPGADRMIGFDGEQANYVVIRPDDRVIIHTIDRTGADEVVTDWQLPKARVASRDPLVPTVRKARPSDGLPPILGSGTVNDDGLCTYYPQDEDGGYTESGPNNIAGFIVEYSITTMPELQDGEKEENLILLITPKHNATHEGIEGLQALYPGKTLAADPENGGDNGVSPQNLSMLGPWIYPNYRQAYHPLRTLRLWWPRPYKGGRFDVSSEDTTRGPEPAWARKVNQPTPYQYYHLGFHNEYGDYDRNRYIPTVYSEAILMQYGSLATWSQLPGYSDPYRPVIRRIRQDPDYPIIVEFPYLVSNADGTMKPSPSGLGPPKSRTLPSKWIFSPAYESKSIRWDDASDVGVTTDPRPFLPRHGPDIFHDALEWVATWLYIEQEDAIVEPEPVIPEAALISGVSLGGVSLGLVAH